MRQRRSGAVIGLAVLLSCTAVFAYAKQLGPSEARNAVAKLLGTSRDDVRIVSVSPGPLGSDAIVIAQMNVPFQLHKEKSGEWRVASVRLHDGSWEDVELLRRALDAEKTARAHADLTALAAGIEAFKRDRGFYPDVDSTAAVVDLITPSYLPSVIRQDPWNKPYRYQASATGFSLASNGPDGEASTADDVVLSSPAWASR